MEITLKKFSRVSNPVGVSAGHRAAASVPLRGRRGAERGARPVAGVPPPPDVGARDLQARVRQARRQDGRPAERQPTGLGRRVLRRGSELDAARRRDARRHLRQHVAVGRPGAGARARVRQRRVQGEAAAAAA